MAIKGKVIVVGQQLSGVSKSKGTPWRKQEFVIETNDKYPTTVAFSLMNDKIDQANIQVGQFVEVEANASSREYNGKWYTELTAWKVNNYGFVTATANQQPVYQQSAPQGYVPTAEPVNHFGQPAPTSAYQSNNESMPF